MKLCVFYLNDIYKLSQQDSREMKEMHHKKKYHILSKDQGPLKNKKKKKK